MTPIASIIIDTFNHGQFLEEAIASCIEQTVSRNEFEIIVVDDGSTDNSAEKAGLFGQEINYIRKSNGGQGSAFNLGFSIAKGKYIILLDGDDCCLPKRLELVLQEFEKYPEVGIVLNARHVVGKYVDEWETTPELHDVSLTRESALNIALANHGTSRTALRSEILKKILPIPEETVICADIYLLAAVWFSSVSCLPNHLTRYRVHESNLFHTDDKGKLEQKIFSIEANLSALKRKIQESERYHPLVTRDALLSIEILLMQNKFAQSMIEGRASRLKLLEIELSRIRLRNKEWSKLYKISKWLKLPICLILSPQSIKSLRKAWSRSLKIWH